MNAFFFHTDSTSVLKPAATVAASEDQTNAPDTPDTPDTPDAPASDAGEPSTGDQAGTAVAEPPAEMEQKSEKSEKTKKPVRKSLPPWKVLLHNDEVNAFEDVILAILEITPLNPSRAIQVTYDAHRRGMSLILTTHRERAELFVEQFRSKKIKASAEPA